MLSILKNHNVTVGKFEIIRIGHRVGHCILKNRYFLVLYYSNYNFINRLMDKLDYKYNSKGWYEYPYYKTKLDADIDNFDFMEYLDNEADNEADIEY